MKTVISFVLLLCFFWFDSMAMAGGKTIAERYQLRGNTAVRISMETGWKRDDMTPVQLDIQGLNLALWMDDEGRVFSDSLLRYGKAKGRKGMRQELFRIDKARGQIQRGGRILNGRVYEQSPIRTCLRLDNLPLALELDVQQGRAILDLNGIAIPARLHVEQESGGVRELEIGERGNRDQGNLLLDARHGRLIWQDNRIKPGLEEQKNSRTYWAEKQK